MDDKEFEHWLSEKESTSFRSKLDLMNLKLPGNIHKIKGMTPEIQSQIQQAIDKLQHQYEIKLTTIEVGKMNRGDVFGAGPYLDDSGNLRFGLVINEDADYDKIKRLIRKRYSKGIFAGKTIEDYVAHEMAHIMTYQDCENEAQYLTKKQIISKQFVRGISGYADKTEDGTESLAEAFVRYRNKEKIPLQAEILVRTYIERWKK